MALLYRPPSLQPADIRGRAKIAEDNGSSSPKRDEGEHGGDWNDEFV